MSRDPDNRNPAVYGGSMTIQQMQDALDVIVSQRYKDYVLPILKNKKDTVTSWICSSNHDDEKNRGSLKTLVWVIDLENSLRRDIEAEKNRKIP